MADIASNISKINDIEVALDANLSEQFFNKIGANINALIDISGNYQLFTSSGSFTVPENVQRGFIYACGGGGGGGGGNLSSSGDPSPSGGCSNQGGFGSLALLRSVVMTPNDIITITIGVAGTGQTGNGTGGNGGNTIYAPTSNPTYTFYGGSGGFGGRAGVSDFLIPHYENERLASTRFNNTYGGFHSTAGSGSGYTGWSKTWDGQSDLYIGGASGTNAAFGGGGGASSFGAGGSGATSTSANGVAPSGTSYGAGGGGGGGTTGGAAGDGANGAAGVMLIIW